MNGTQQPPNSAESTTPKYFHPRIILIDIEEQALLDLQAQGYNVCSGSFGTPYRVQKSDKLSPVLMETGILPDCTEQEIVIIDLNTGKPLTQSRGEKVTTDGQNDWWVRSTTGIIDPRPRLMDRVRELFDRILSHNGVFIIFADEQNSQTVHWAAINQYGNLALTDAKKLYVHNWCFLESLLTQLHVDDDSGQEITVLHNDTPISNVLWKHCEGASFSCTLRPWGLGDRWITLAENKYGQAVAGAVRAHTESDKPTGLVLVFPQLQNKTAFILDLLKNVLPDLSPHLFPDHEGARWVHRPEYELPKVLEKIGEIEQVQQAANARVAELERAIEQKQGSESYWYDLLTGTGDTLVAAVKRTLELLGFSVVVDMDQEIEEAGTTEQKREDLQIRDTSPLLLVEVKGLTGIPKDADALQVWKYLSPRMKELEQFDIKGLSIVNHQRNIPPLERDEPFRDDILVNARDKFGLLTTWDLFRLLRSFVKNDWEHEQVRELFYQDGRIQPVPTHYSMIGVVEKFYKKVPAVIVPIETGQVQMGDRIAFELPVEFYEQTVDSLQLNDNAVDQVTHGEVAGIRTDLSSEQLKPGIRVFRIESSASGVNEQ